MSLLTRAVATLAASAVVLAPSAFSSAHASPTIAPPHADTDFQYTGDLAAQPAGKTLKQRGVSITLTNPFTGVAFSVPAEQLLYRTRDEQGNAATSITTVINPIGASAGLIGYDSFYDALGDQCDPSYTLRDGTTGDEAKVIGLLASGYAVTVPDFEGQTVDGTNLHWAAGHESGASTLDAVRATESYLSSIGQGAGSNTKVGLMGYSGGSIGAEWATEMAPAYAPELNIVGTAVGGIPVNLSHVMSYVDGSAGWSGVIPAALDSLGTAYGQESTLRSYETTTPTYVHGVTSLSGRDIADEVSDACIGDFADDYPGLKFNDLVNPADLAAARATVDGIAGGLVMGSAGTPTAPMLMINGNSDGTGDGVMVAADVRALANQYCAAGATVQYTEVAGADHGTVGGQTFPLAAWSYLGDRLAGKAAPTTCPPPVDNAQHSPSGSAQTQLAAITAKLKGHSKRNNDVLVVKAKGVAKGTKVKLFAKGHKKAVAHGRLDKHGKLTVSVRDHNGAKKTRYQAVVKATPTTASGTSKVLKLR